MIISCRVLITATDFPPSVGGIQQWVVQIARHLSARHAVTVVAPGQAGDRAFDRGLPFRVLRYPQTRLGPGRLAMLAAYTTRAVIQHRPDVILHGHILAAIVAQPLLSQFTPPFVIAAYGMELQAHRLRGLRRAALRSCAACIAISQHTAGLAVHSGAAKDNVRLIGCGVLGDLLTAPWSGAELPPDLDAATGPIILTVARLNERYKGHDVLLQALPLILAKVPDTTYVIAGDGVYRRYYAQLAESLGVSANVRFLGRISDTQLLALYDRCDVLAMVSRDGVDGVEGFGIVFLEAAARCKPAIGGRSGGVPDAIVDGETGILVDPNDIAAIAEACIRLLTDRELARQMGQAGRQRVAEQFTWPRIAEQVEEVLLQAVDQRGARP